MGTYAELKNLQMTVNMVNIIKRKKWDADSTREQAGRAASQAASPAEKRSIHFACLGFSWQVPGIWTASSPRPSAFSPLTTYADKTFSSFYSVTRNMQGFESDYKVIPICLPLCSLFKVHQSGVLCQVHGEALCPSPHGAGVNDQIPLHGHPWETTYKGTLCFSDSRIPGHPSFLVF